MSKKEIVIDEYDLVIKTLKKMGYKTTDKRDRNRNGSDIYAIANDRVLSVEIKRAVAGKGLNVLRVRKVEMGRRGDDLIAIVLPSNYVLVEPMRDHLLACNKTGDRFLNY